jgi:hypothetical protein
MTFVKANERINRNLMNTNDEQHKISLLSQKFKNKKKIDENNRRKK